MIFIFPHLVPTCVLPSKWRRLKVIFCLIPLLCILFSCSEDAEESEEIIPEERFSLLAELHLPGKNNDLWGYTAGGKEYVIVASEASFHEAGQVSIVDITTPNTPSIVSVIPMAGVDVKSWKQYIYIAQGSNTEGAPPSQIYDISNPAEPIQVGSLPAFHNLFIDELGYLFVTGFYSSVDIPDSKGLNVSIYDLNESPEAPELIWTAPSNGAAAVPEHDISVIRNRLYTFSTSRSQVQIYDVSDRTSPMYLGQYLYQNREKVHSGWVSEDDRYLYVCMEENEEEALDVSILDISNPAFPKEVGMIHDTVNTIHNLYVIDNFAYTSFYHAGFRVYDLTNPIEPELIYAYDTNEPRLGLGAFGVYPFSQNGIITVSDWEYGLFVFKEN